MDVLDTISEDILVKEEIQVPALPNIEHETNLECETNIIEPVENTTDVTNETATSAYEQIAECIEEGFESKDTDKILTEYDQQVSKLAVKTENGWKCSQCSYSMKGRGHVLEHAEMHIKGYSHECMYCDKTYSMKRNIRHHIRRFHGLSTKQEKEVVQHIYGLSTCSILLVNMAW